MSAKELARRIDHTLLRPEASGAEIRELCREARELGVAAVCVASTRAGLAARELSGSGISVCCVVGFPFGAAPGAAKAVEALDAIASGASEIDMVANLGALRDGDDDVAYADIAVVRQTIGDRALLKVIVESAALSDEELVRACEIVVDAGADFVKTSTGYHPAGGATLDAVRLMRSVVGERAQVKASGGIRTRAQAEAMLAAGADRLGTSRTAELLREGA